jgi:guanidinoacetate N-methyltransferase
MHIIKKITSNIQKKARAGRRSASAAVQRWGDSRDTTHNIRVEIGFQKEKEKWKKAAARFTKHTLQILGHPVMEDWETPYMLRLAQIASSKGGTVLEVGFGMGISAGFIQEYNIERHIIIEMNEEVAVRARTFAKKAKHPVVVLEGLWEEVIKKIPNNSLDGILFDTYPLSELEIHKNHFFFFKTAYKKLKRSGVFTYYSDEIKTFTPTHQKKLIEAGFKKRHIESVIVPIHPPKNCKYWKSDTILAPIIRKD